MKKSIPALTAIVLIISAILFVTCKKDKEDEKTKTEDCTALSNAYYQASLAYISDPTSSEKCQNFVDATKAYINNCGILTPEQKAEFQASIDAADCTPQ